MRVSFVSLATAATFALGVAIAGSTPANAESVMAACASQWKQAQAAGTTGGQTWPQFLTQCRASQGAGSPSAATAAPAPAPAAQSGSLFPWWQPSAPASAPASNVGAPSGAQSAMRLCASQWKDAKAAGTTGGLTWPPVAMPFAPKLGRVALWRVCVRAGARACPSVRLFVPVVAAVQSRVHARVERRLGRGRPRGSVHDRASGARPLPVGHSRLGQHLDARLPLRGHPLLRAHPPGRLYVRSRRARGRVSRGAEPRTRGPGPFGVTAPPSADEKRPSHPRQLDAPHATSR